MVDFAPDTVHGLSADVYFNGQPVRVLGGVLFNHAIEKLDLTANDEGAIGPVKTLRRGDATTVTVPLTDTLGLATWSGIALPFASGITSGPTSGAIVLPKAQPGDDYLEEAHELRLVTRDGAATLVFSSAVVTELDELEMNEEDQQVWAATFTCYRFTHSGQSTPFYILSGSHPPA
jgi:hypothetical protein